MRYMLYLFQLKLRTTESSTNIQDVHVKAYFLLQTQRRLSTPIVA